MKPASILGHDLFRKLAIPAAATAAALAGAPAHAETRVLTGHVPQAVSRALAVGLADPGAPLKLTIALPLRNRAALNALLADLYDPASPSYHQFVTPEQFTQWFGPTEADYRAVAAFAQSRGMTVTKTYPSRMALDVIAPIATAEKAFHVNEVVYQRGDGSTFYAPDRDPAVDASLPIQAVVGLDDAVVPQRRLVEMAQHERPNGVVANASTPSGMSPSQMRKAYMSGITLDGSGQTLGLVEFDGYNASDVTAYQSYYGTNATVKNVLIDGSTSLPVNGDPLEQSLDIDVMCGVAPNSTILVYIAQNFSNFHDLLLQIAEDDAATSISTSWGWSGSADTATSAILQRYAAQGQSFLSASGDAGAWPDGYPNPTQDPYCTAVGGTSLSIASDGTWKSETGWSGSGGGISANWSIPSYQTPVITAASLGSTTNRNVPDISANAWGPGYAVYDSGSWHTVGGTSASTPLWAAFIGLVNQQRAANGLGPIGFLNPTLYSLCQTSAYAADFHDIADGSSNGTYSSVTGFDLVTGWGSPIGSPLLASLSGSAASTAAIKSVALSPATVYGGVSSTGTVTLTAAATVATKVTLASSDASVTVPSSVTIAAGATSATFTARTTPLASTTTVTITATSGTSVKTATLKVAHPDLTFAVISPAEVIGGNTATVAVTLSSKAPTGGTSVGLAYLSGKSLLASPPSAVVVPAGATTASVTLATAAVTDSGSVSIEAHLGSVNETVGLTVDPPTVKSFALAPSRVYGGVSSTGTITLAAATGARTTFTLTSGDASVTVPGTVTVPAGATSATFTAKTTPLASTTAVTITAILGTATKTATLTVAHPDLTTTALTPSGVTGGNTATLTVTLSSNAPTGGTAVGLTYPTNGSLLVSPPSRVVVPAGATTASVTLTTTTVTTTSTVGILAHLGAVNQTVNLSVYPVIVQGQEVLP